MKRVALRLLLLSRHVRLFWFPLAVVALPDCALSSSIAPSAIDSSLGQVVRDKVTHGVISASVPRAVTYDFSHGRFGDNLISYLHAKWYAFQEDIPLIYKPFPLSSHLMLDELEFRYEQLPTEPRTRCYLGRHHVQIPNISVIYICPYFPEERTEWNDPRYFCKFDVDWTNPTFRKIARSMLAPKQALQLIKPPPNVRSIAIHWREGGGYDTPNVFREIPLKFPPSSFYQQSFRKALDRLSGEAVYCHVFTDALNPTPLIAQLQDVLQPTDRVTFAWRKERNGPHTNILEDFFSLFEFEILIRPQSNFSIVPSLLNDYTAVYEPTSYAISADGTVRIDQIKVSGAWQ